MFFFSAPADMLPAEPVKDINASNNVEECSSAHARNHSPQQYGRWSYVFLNKDENIPSSILNRLNEGLEESGVICLGHYLTNALNTHSMIIKNFSDGTRNKFLLVREVERNFAPNRVHKLWV